MFSNSLLNHRSNESYLKPVSDDDGYIRNRSTVTAAGNQLLVSHIFKGLNYVRLFLHVSNVAHCVDHLTFVLVCIQEEDIFWTCTEQNHTNLNVLRSQRTKSIDHVDDELLLQLVISRFIVLYATGTVHHNNYICLSVAYH